MKRQLNLILILAIILTSCVKEDYFGLSDYGNIKSFLVSNQAGNAMISNDSMSVVVEIPGGHRSFNHNHTNPGSIFICYRR